MEVLENLIISMKKYNIEIFFVWIHANLWKQFNAIWYLKEFWKHNIFPDINESINYLKSTWKHLNIQHLVKYSPIKKN
jgi:hypothetical protein